MVSDTDDDHVALVDELKSLRPRSGLTFDKLKAASRLLAVLAKLHGHALSDLQRAHDALVVELDALGDSSHARAARNALGIRMKAPSNLGDRREQFATTEGRHSSDTIENWENAAFNELALRLLNRQESPLVVNTPSPIDLDTGAARYITELFERTSYYADRKLQEIQSTRTIRASVDGLERITGMVRFGPHSSGISIERCVGCINEWIVYHDNGAAEYSFQFPHPLAKGEVHTYSTRIIPRFDDEAEPKIIYWPSLKNPMRQLVMRLQFDGRSVPQKMWRVDGLTHLRSPGSPELCPSVEPDRFGGLTLRFDNLASNLGYGVAWEW